MCIFRKDSHRISQCSFPQYQYYVCIEKIEYEDKTGAGDEGVVACGGGGGGGGDEGGESTVVDSAMTAGNGAMGGDRDATAVVAVSSGLDVT